MLRGKKFQEYKFTRQKPIGNFIVDFYCSELKLAIEVDGDSHFGKEETDEAREKSLKEYGITILRYTNEEVIFNISGVYDDLVIRIGDLKSPTRPPLDRGGGSG